MSVINYLKKVQLPNNTEYTVKDPTFFTGTTAEWNLLSTEEKKTYQIVNLTDDEEEGDISGKADKVTGAIAGNFAGLDSNGNLTDSGHKHSDYLTQHQDISGKADKVSGATNGNLAGLNALGNLTDSTWNANKTTQSVTGNPISISGLKSNQLAINPIITLEPIQAGSGTPSPSNIRAISGYDKIEVLSCGKNLFDKNTIVSNKGYTPTGEQSLSGGLHSDYIPIKPNTDYYLSNVYGTGAYYSSIHFDKYFNNLGSKDLPGNGIQSGKITSFADSAYMIINTGGTIVDTTQVTEGSTATTYVPYHKTTSISESLGQTVYGGSLDLRSGKLTVTHKAVDMGNLTWSAFGSSYPSIFYAEITDGILMTVPTGSDHGTCEIYAVVAKYILTLGDKECTLGSTNVYNNKGSIMLKDTTYTDATSLKTALTGQKLVYELATPFTIQLTPHEISLLKDYAYVSTNGTSIALDYHNGELASLGDVAQLGETMNALPNFFLPDYANALSVHSGALEINSSYSEYIAPQNGYIIIAEMYGAVDTSSTPFSPPYFDCRIDQKRIFSTQAFLATNNRASGTIIPIAKGSLFQYRVTNKKLNELIIWFAPIKYV